MNFFRKIPPEWGLLALALFLRLWHLGKQSIWMDEGYSIWAASHPVKIIVDILRNADAHPPLFYAFLHLWLLAGKSPGLLRLPFALIGSLNTVLLYRLGKKYFDKQTGFLAALFWACLFLPILYETEVRMYALAPFFALLATEFLIDAFRDPSRSRWFRYYCSCALCLYTHYYTAFVILGHFLFLIYKRRLREAAWGGIILAVIFLPWGITMRDQFLIPVHMPQAHWKDAFGILPNFAGFFAGLSGLRPFAEGVVGLAAALGIYSLSVKSDESRLLLFSLLSAWFVPLAISMNSPLHVFLGRYIIIFAPFFYLALSRGFLLLPKVFSFPLLAAVFSANLFLWHLFVSAPGANRQDWKEASHFLSQRLAAHDAVFVSQRSGIYPLAYYLPKNQMRIEWNSKSKKIEVDGDDIVWAMPTEKTPETELKKISAGSKRQWLVICQDYMSDPKHTVFVWFNNHEKGIVSANFPAFENSEKIYIFLFH